MATEIRGSARKDGRFGVKEERERSYWGWGYADQVLPEKLLARFQGTLQMALGLDALRHREPLALSALRLRVPRFALPPSLRDICTEETPERARHSYGKAFRDVVRGLYGQFDNPPDYVAYPRSEADIERLFAFCGASNVALIPFGGGSSVVGGVEPPRTAGYAGAISCDMRFFDRVIRVDRESRTATIQSGIYGPALEAALKPHGLTLRHFPQSFEFSTLGGWIATRSGGHYATVQTHIDEFVQSVRMVTPKGVLETRALPGSGAGPEPSRWVIGSEGIFGILTEATMRLQDIPQHRSKSTVSFASENAGFAAVRQISQSGLSPANCRLISSMEAFSMGAGDGSETILLLGFESHDHPQQQRLERALAICAHHDGSPKALQGRALDDEEGDASERWKQSFLLAPYLRDAMLCCGILLETFETAVTWDRFAAFHQAVIAAATDALQVHCGGGLITWRFTHVYPDGPAPYYSVVAPAREGQEVEQWDAIKFAVSDAILAYGGTITHHHAVGKDHRPWYTQQISPLFGEILHQAKRSLDPAWILNPEVLLPPDPPHPKRS